MPSRMSDQQRAKQKAAAQTTANLRALAVAANGHSVTRTEKDKAARDLVSAVGKRKAKQLQEIEMQRAGAPAKGLRRLFG